MKQKNSLINKGKLKMATTGLFKFKQLLLHLRPMQIPLVSFNINEIYEWNKTNPTCLGIEPLQTNTSFSMTFLLGGWDGDTTITTVDLISFLWQLPMKHPTFANASPIGKGWKRMGFPFLQWIILVLLKGGRDDLTPLEGNIYLVYTGARESHA